LPFDGVFPYLLSLPGQPIGERVKLAVFIDASPTYPFPFRTLHGFDERIVNEFIVVLDKLFLVDDGFEWV
jgi:hypothetical protein